MEEKNLKEHKKYAADIDSITKAHTRIKPYIHKTPVLSSETLNSIAGKSLFFKCECFKKGGMTEQKKVQRRKTLAKWLKESILRLGPTFIKIGQQFSTRVDILAQEYVYRLSELQDQVPPFPSETAVSIIEEELGAPVNEVFDYFDF